MDPIEIVNFAYQEMLKKEGASLRAFSKFLSIHPSTLSKILSGRRGIPKSLATKFAQKLLENSEERELFIDAVLNFKGTEDSKLEMVQNIKLDENDSGDIFKIISEWEFFAILNILKVKKINNDGKFIEKSLNISPGRVKYCLEILSRNKLIMIKNGQIYRTAQNLKTTNEITSRALKLAHIEELVLAKNKIEIDLELKDFQSDVFTVSLKDLKKIKKIINKMYIEVDKVTDKSNPEEVYMLNLQLFPLSNCKLAEQLLAKEKRGKYDH